MSLYRTAISFEDYIYLLDLFYNSLLTFPTLFLLSNFPSVSHCVHSNNSRLAYAGRFIFSFHT